MTPGGQFVGPVSFDSIFRVKPDVIQYQVYQSNVKHLDVRIVTKNRNNSILLDDIRKELRDYFSEPMRITLSVVDRIKLGKSGKHHYVISEVKSNSINN